MNWLLSLYIATAVLGIGVKIVDLLGLFSGDEDKEGETGQNFDEQDSIEETQGTDDQNADMDTEENGIKGAQDSILYKDKNRYGDSIITLISVLRYTVYFCLGFGPVGLFYIIMYEKNLASLYYSVPMGFVVILIVIIVRKTLIKELDSRFKDSDFIMEKAEVLVTIGKKSMGKIRINYAGTYQDRYARNSDRDKIIERGSLVRIIDITDECFIVKTE